MAVLDSEHKRADAQALHATERSSVCALIADLQDALAAYDALRNGHASPVPLQTFDDIPQVLIEGRIARGLSQRELAERIGVKQQQIQRYEATNYESASLRRIIAIAHSAYRIARWYVLRLTQRNALMCI